MFFAQNQFSWPNGQLLPIHTIHILKAIVPAVNLAYLGKSDKMAQKCCFHVPLKINSEVIVAEVS